MNNTFELKKGKLVFEKDKIVIVDFARNTKIYRLFTLSAGILLGISYLIKYLKTGDMFSLRFGLGIGISSLLPFTLELLYSVKSEISYNEIKSMKIRRIYFTDYLYIKLNNKKIRRVVGILNTERLEDYINVVRA
ncbi:MAG: hypothetical protein WCK18_04240 [Prolixibacteraceae bacterium]